MSTLMNNRGYFEWINKGCPMDTSTHVLLLNSEGKKITIPSTIFRLQNLKTLWGLFCSIKTIPPEIGMLRQLTQLSLGGNELKIVPPEIGQLQRLEKLWLYGNSLTSVPREIGQLSQLTHLWLQNNNLTSVPVEIGQLQNLSHLMLSRNRLRDVPIEIGQLQNLNSLALDFNCLRTIPPEIGQLRNIQDLWIDNNPIEHIPVNVVRILERQRVIAPGVYKDAQSVHNSNIQKTLQKSILRLLEKSLEEHNVIPLILSDQILSPFTKQSLVEYARDETVYTSLNITFSDALTAVWNRILILPQPDEIKKVLNAEMLDAECKCFMGRLTRLINCLSGFDELVSIQISENEQIGAVISNVKIILESKNEYSVDKHKEDARQRLRELQIKEDEIELWLSYIEE